MRGKRTGWVDLLRIVACAMVVVGHCCDPFVAKLSTSMSEFLAGVAVGSFVRPSVPLFVMMTAVLLLPVREGVKSFYSKRIKRVGVALIFWSIISPILFYLYVHFINPATIHPNIVLADHTFEATVRKFYTLFFNFSYETLIYWYIYMLIGLYLIMPIVSSWLEKASKSELRLMLWIWISTTFLPYIQMFAPMIGYKGNYGNMGLYGICDWNPYGMFHYVSGFIGYMLLAYYLTQYPLKWSWTKTLVRMIPLFVLGYLITFMGFLKINELFPGDFHKFELIWSFNGINVVMMTFPMFAIGQKVKLDSTPFLSKAASLMFGVYLVHFIFVHIAYDLFYVCMPIAPVLQILVMGICSLAVTFVICYLLSLSKWGRRVIL